MINKIKILVLKSFKAAHIYKMTGLRERERERQKRRVVHLNIESD